MNNRVVLEKEACEVSKQNSKPPLIFQLPVCEGRKVLENAQNSYVYMYPAQIQKDYINTQKNGEIAVYTITPSYLKNIRNVIFYIHGAGWVFGSFHTHEKLVRELAYRTNSVVIFPEYARSPEAKYPVAIEQCYYVLNNIPKLLKDKNINADLNTLTVAGDSVGGNMAISMSLMSKRDNSIKINKLLLYYPVTNDNFNTGSYCRFATGYYLYREGMKWFWNQYEPNYEKRKGILITPLKASLEQLKNMPDTMILNGQADVLRDEGIEFANKLRAACNNVTAIQFQGIIHDFVMLNSLDQTIACRSAMDASTSWINKKNLEQVKRTKRLI